MQKLTDYFLNIIREQNADATTITIEDVAINDGKVTLDVQHPGGRIETIIISNATVETIEY